MSPGVLNAKAGSLYVISLGSNLGTTDTFALLVRIPLVHGHLSFSYEEKKQNRKR